MRWNEQPRDFANALASVVLPIPGTSSKSTCPSQSSATINRSITSSLPTITRPTFWRIERAASCTWRISSVCVMGSALSFTARRSLVFLAQCHTLELYAQKEMNFTHHRNQRFVQIQAGIVPDGVTPVGGAWGEVLLSLKKLGFIALLTREKNNNPAMSTRPTAIINTLYAGSLRQKYISLARGSLGGIAAGRMRCSGRTCIWCRLPPGVEDSFPSGD